MLWMVQPLTDYTKRTHLAVFSGHVSAGSVNFAYDDLNFQHLFHRAPSDRRAPHLVGVVPGMDCFIHPPNPPFISVKKIMNIITSQTLWHLLGQVSWLVLEVWPCCQSRSGRVRGSELKEGVLSSEFNPDVSLGLVSQRRYQYTTCP